MVKIMHKKLICLVLAVLCLAVLASCGNNSANTQEAPSKGKISEELTKALSAMSEAQAGSYVTFGSYEQDGNPDNGAEALEWLVLAKEDSRILLISRYGIDFTHFHLSRSVVTWETCYIREWLNNTFVNTAFTEEEKAVIPSVTVKADKNPNKEGSKSPGNDTTDQLFLLSIPEAYQYLSTDEARVCYATKYAMGQESAADHFDRNAETARTMWWLRTPGTSRFKAAYVDMIGAISEYGTEVDANAIAIRPAMWVEFGD